MADDINNNEGMDEAGDAGMPDDLKRLLARAEQGEDGDPDAYNPDADDDEEEDDAELEESFGEVDRGASAGEDINGGQLQISEFGREMKQSFIEYSMSVITAPRCSSSTPRTMPPPSSGPSVVDGSSRSCAPTATTTTSTRWVTWCARPVPRHPCTRTTGCCGTRPSPSRPVESSPTVRSSPSATSS